MSPHGSGGTGGGTSNLGNLQVTFTAQGLAQLQQGIAKLQQAFASIGQAAAKAGEQAESGFLKKLQAAGAGAGIVFGTLKDTVGGFVRAGLNASAAGQVISIQMEQLSREIASLFLPAIQGAIDLLQKAVQWFRGLSGEQQDAIGKWLLWTGGLSLALTMLPRIIQGIQGVKVAAKALGAVLQSMFMTPWGIILTALAAIAAAVVRWHGGMDTLAVLVDGIGEAFKGIGEMIGSIVDGILEMVDGLGEFLGLAKSARAEGKEDADSWSARRAGLLKTLEEDKERGVGGAGFLHGAVSIPGLGHLLAGIMDVHKGSGLLDIGAIGAAELARKKKGRPHHTLRGRLGGVTSLEAHWNKIAEASVKVTSGLATKTPAEKSAESLEKIEGLLSAAMHDYRGKLPPLTRK